MATWPSGKAEACKAFITGSIPVVASNLPPLFQFSEHPYVVSRARRHCLGCHAHACRRLNRQNLVSRPLLDEIGSSVENGIPEHPADCRIFTIGRASLGLSAVKTRESRHNPQSLPCRLPALRHKRASWPQMDENVVSVDTSSPRDTIPRHSAPLPAHENAPAARRPQGRSAAVLVAPPGFEPGTCRL